MTFLEIIFITLLIVIAPLLLYQFLLSLLALNAKIQTTFGTEKNRRFAIVIPAHNEEKIISKTIYSLSALIYPKKLYDVFVIADNCDDNTADVARSLGVTVLERFHRTRKGKGYALRWAFNRLLNTDETYDALLVVDADSLISGNYLEVMNYYLEKGSDVIQSNDQVLPEPGNWSVEATQIGFLLYNYVKPLGRKVLNFNMGLRGNGMCFRAEVLKKIPWKAWSLTEDVEYGMILMLNDIKIDFAPEASVLAQMPIEASNAESQRARWEMGRYQIIKNYAPKFLMESLKKRSAAFLDVFLDLITPPFVNVMLVISLILTAAVTFWAVGVLPILYPIIWALLLAVGILYLFIGLYVAGANKELYKSLLRIPSYIFWKVKLYGKTIKKGKEVHWVKTERDNQ